MTRMNTSAISALQGGPALGAGGQRLDKGGQGAQLAKPPEDDQTYHQPHALV